MSLTKPLKHRSMLPNLLSDAEMDTIVDLIYAHCLTPFGTVDTVALLALLRQFKRAGVPTAILDAFFPFINQREAANRYRMGRLSRLLQSIGVDCRNKNGKIFVARAFRAATTVLGKVKAQRARVRMAKVRRASNNL